jgi:hypothetical protein
MWKPLNVLGWAMVDAVGIEFSTKRIFNNMQVSG